MTFDDTRPVSCRTLVDVDGSATTPVRGVTRVHRLGDAAHRRRRRLVGAAQREARRARRLLRHRRRRRRGARAGHHRDADLVRRLGVLRPRRPEGPATRPGCCAGLRDGDARGRLRDARAWATRSSLRPALRRRRAHRDGVRRGRRRAGLGYACPGDPASCDVHRLPRRRARLLRRPRGRQHQVVLGGRTRRRLRRVGEGADDGADRRAGRRSSARRRCSGPTATCASPRTRRRTRPTRARSSRPARAPGGTSRCRRAASAPAPASTTPPAAAGRDPRRRSPTTAHGPSWSGSSPTLEADGWSRSAATGSRPRPRGYDTDHPRIELLRHQSLIVGRALRLRAGRSTRPELLERVRDDWRSLRPFVEWVSRPRRPREQRARRSVRLPGVLVVGARGDRLGQLARGQVGDVTCSKTSRSERRAAIQTCWRTSARSL